jgi:ParB family chromosome partitioning protein
MATPRDRLQGKTSNLAIVTDDNKRLDDHPAAAKRGNGTYAIVPINLIITDPDQPRKYFDDAKHEKLTSSVKAKGIIEPLVVREDENGKVFLVAGERRLRAAKAAEMLEVPVTIRTDSPAEISMIENLHREDLRPIEVAEGLQRMIKELNYHQEDAAEVIGKSISSVSETLSILRLPDTIKEAIRGENSDKYPLRLLSAIAKQDTPEEMTALFDRYEKGLPVEAVRKLAKKSKAGTNDLPAGINKRINAFNKYVEQNVTADNITVVWDNLKKTYDLVLALLYHEEEVQPEADVKQDTQN